MELQCWCPSGPCGQELSCKGGRGEEVDGESLRPNALKHKEKLSSKPLAFFTLSPIKQTLSSPGHKSARTLGVYQEAKELQIEFDAQALKVNLT